MDEGMMETQGIHEHTGFPTGRNSFKTTGFVLYKFSFYRNKRAVTGK